MKQFFNQILHLTSSSRKQRKIVAKKQRTIDDFDYEEGGPVLGQNGVDDELVLLDEAGESNISSTEGFISTIAANPCHFVHVYTGRLSTLYEEDAREECKDVDATFSDAGLYRNLDQEFIRERWIFMNNMSGTSDDSLEKTPRRRKSSLSLLSSSPCFSNRSPTGSRVRQLSSSNSLFSIEMAEI